MNPQIRKLGGVLLACYLALFVQLNLVQVVKAPALNKRPDNTRVIERDVNRPRGDIVSADGQLLAHSVETPGRFRYQRVYPTGDLFAHVVGSYSFLFGADGVERQYGDELAGQTVSLRFGGFADPFQATPNVGDVHLTIDSKVQRAAASALRTQRGSVVAVDPRDGSILALWSNPTYDPTFSSSNDSGIARSFRQDLAENPDKPTLARAYRERFFPGSTFKVVTAAAGLESGTVTETDPAYPSARSYQPPLTTRSISNFGGSSCGGVLAEILAVSCNSAFAEMGAETIGPVAMIDTARRFGFGEKPPIDLPGAVSSVFPDDFGKRLRPGDDPGDADVYEDTPALAQAAIGQGNVSATPLQMALVAAAVANGGTIMRPHVLREIRDARGDVDSSYTPAVWRTAMSPTSAATLRAAMVGVVNGGTAQRLAIPGREVGGKTGTAQLGTNPPQSHAWIIGFAGAPGQTPSVAVAVIVEGQPGASEQTGGRVAAPIAKAVLEAVLAGQ